MTRSEGRACSTKVPTQDYPLPARLSVTIMRITKEKVVITNWRQIHNGKSVYVNMASSMQYNNSYQGNSRSFGHPPPHSPAHQSATGPQPCSPVCHWTTALFTSLPLDPSPSPIPTTFTSSSLFYLCLCS